MSKASSGPQFLTRRQCADMPAIGTIEIAVDFLDSTQRETKTILKRIQASEVTDYSTATVAILTGTVGTAAVSLTFNPTGYRDSSGAFVSFATASNSCRIALQADGPDPVVMVDADLQEFSLSSRSSQVASTTWGQSSIASGIELRTYAGTNTYSVFLLDAG